MPSAFDQFGPFENSLRSYNEGGSRGARGCPRGLHAAGECSCESTHECKRPHCSNDVPLDPCCKLANGTPYGVPITSWPTNRCHEVPPQMPTKPLSMFSSMVADRLYSTSTRASAAKKRAGSAGRHPYEIDQYSSVDKLNKTDYLVDNEISYEDPRTRLISQLIESPNQRGHDNARREGIGILSGSFRIRAAGSPKAQRKARETSRIQPNTYMEINGRPFPRGSESEISSIGVSTSPDMSPVSTPSLVTPSPVLSRKQSSPPVSVCYLSEKTVHRPGATPRPAIATFSAAFAGGSLKPPARFAPLNKSASDGIERMRKPYKYDPKNGNVKNKTKKCDSSPPSLVRGRKLLKCCVKLPAKVDNLLKQAGMTLKTLTMELDESFKINGNCTSNYGQESLLDDGYDFKNILHFLDQARTEEQIEANREWMQADRAWLVHRGGFCGAHILTNAEGSDALEEGRLKIKLEHNGEVIEVDEDDVEKANPSNLDRCEDLAQLRYLNESSILHSLRQRYGSNLVHTNAGVSAVVINPTVPLAIYSEKVIQMFKGCKPEDMPPHIYAAAQMAYRDLVTTRRDQSLVFVGRSGAGKTTNFRHALHYLALASASDNSILTVERLNAISTLLEAFGNGRTLLNTNATRFTQIFSLDFDNSGRIVSASVQVYMAEKMRVVKRPEGEPNYHIFYQLLAGVDDELRTYLGIDDLSEPNIFMTPLQRAEDKQRAGVAWARIRAALDVLCVSDEEQKAIWSVLAAIYHLGTAGVTKAPNSNKYHFDKPVYAQKCANLLGTSVEELARTMFLSSSNRTLRCSSPTDRPFERLDGLEALEGMASGLYSETFTAIVALINRCISTSSHATNSLLIVDSPGSQNPASCGRQSGASFSDLCHNYTQERFQMLYHDASITAQTDRYAQEKIDYSDVADDLGTPAPLISLLDKASSSSVVRSSHTDLKEAERRGLLWMLDEEAIYPGASDRTFLDRIFAHYGDKEYSNLIKEGTSQNTFTLLHFQGTNSVTYDVTGWLKSSRENSVLKQAAAVLQESNRENVSRLYVFCRGPVSNTISGSVVGIEGVQSLRRASSIRRAFTTGTAAIKRKSVCLQVKFTVDGIIETLRRTKLRFIHCLLPQHNAGLSDLKSSFFNSPKNLDATINIPLIRSQIRGAQLLDSLRIHKQGFPENLQYCEFWRRFSVLAPPDKRRQKGKNERSAAENILDHIELDSSTYRMGMSQIFFRSGTICSLEEQRDLVLTDSIIRLQSRCRGFLARKRLQKRKVQETAICCIQKNVRKFMGVRDWPWWRLLVRVTPLLNVHRTEEELRRSKDELETLRSRLEKIEKDRNALKLDNDKMEAKLAEVTADLQEQHSTSHLATERLEAEQSERMRLEKEVSQLQEDVNYMTNANGKLEIARMALRSEMIHQQEVNGDSEESDSTIYKRKYEWGVREVDLLKKQIKQQEQDSLDQLAILKKQLDKKYQDCNEEAEEQRQIVGQLKKKSQRLQSEMNDLKMLLDQQNGRNNLLEKKQRKFDQEMNLLQDELKKERLAKDKLQREKDQILADKYYLEQESSTMKLEGELKSEKIISLKSELEDIQYCGKGEQETANLKKIKYSLEKKVKDQEEELDDLAGQVQMLEAAKIRFELSIEQMRKENRMESQQREEEMEEIRMGSHKKIKGLENQLETDYEERSQLVREKHDLERRLADANERTISNVDEEYIHKLKKELRKTKALLKDTQTMLDKTQCEGSNKMILRQLKTQLEDAEFAKTAALKARQSAEADQCEMQFMLDEAGRAKKDTEDRCLRLAKEKADIQMQLEENEEDVSELMKKYKAAVSQLSVDQITMSDQAQQMSELEQQKQILQEKLLELSSKVEVLEGETANIHTQRRLQMKIKELESKLELEQTTKNRLDSQICRLKDHQERTLAELDAVRSRETKSADELKKLSRVLRESKEDLTSVRQKNTDVVSRKQEIEKQLELSESEIMTLKSDLKLAFKRIEDLQQALQGDISDTDSELLDSGSDSESSLSSYLTASLRYQRTSSNSTLRTPSSEMLAESKDDVPRTNSGRSMSAISEDLEESNYAESFA